MRRAVTAVLAAAALSGCVTLKAEHALTGPPRTAWSGPVRIVMEGAPAPGEYDEIAIVTATGAGADATLPTVLDALQREAATLGANAVVRVRYDRGSAAATATGVAVVLR
jgi:ABC-type sulfate transport system permease subunit